MTILRRVLTVALFALSVVAIHGQTANEIVSSVHLIGDGENLTMRVRMDINTQLGEKSRVLSINLKRDDKSWMVLTRVVEPVFLSELKFLYHKYANGGERRWLKTSDGTRSVGSSGGDVRLFDSDFTADDFSYVNTEDHDVRLLERKDDGVFVIVAISRKRRDAVPKRILTIDAQAKLLLNVDYYDTDDELVRRYTLVDTQETSGYLMPKTSTMENLDRGTSTTLHFVEIETGQDLPYRMFNQAGL